MKDLDEVLAKKQHLISDALYTPASGTHSSRQDNTENVYHWTECDYHKKRVNWKKLRWTTKETWTYRKFFKNKLFDNDLEEVNADITTCFAECLSSMSNLELSANALHQSSVNVSSSISAVHKIQALNAQTCSNLETTKNLITQHLKAMNEIQIACVLGAKFDTEGSEHLEKIIEEFNLKFHPDIAATFAIERNNSRFIDLVLAQQASLDTNFVEDQGKEKTLLQLAVAKCDPDIIHKVLLATKQCDNSLLYALSDTDGDIATVTAILSHYPNMATSFLLDGLTPLHYAIGNHHFHIVQYILKSHSSSLNIKTQNGDSVFKIALRSGDVQIIRMIGEQMTTSQLQDEWKELFMHNEETLLTAAQNLGLVTTDFINGLYRWDNIDHVINIETIVDVTGHNNDIRVI